MTFNEYQIEARKNHKSGCGEIVFALGLGGESGEVLDIIKKSKRDLKPIDKEHMKEELGDVLWYISNLSFEYGFTLEEVARANIEKLNKRYGGKKN